MLKWIIIGAVVLYVIALLIQYADGTSESQNYKNKPSDTKLKSPQNTSRTYQTTSSKPHYQPHYSNPGYHAEYNDIQRQIDRLTHATQRKGEYGEELLLNALNFIRDKHYVLHSLYVPITNPTSAVTYNEIDVVLICKTGVWVIENKHYEGGLYGNISDSNWYRLFEGRKITVRSPYKQNLNHIKNISEIDGLARFKDKIKGVVTLSDSDFFQINTLSKDKDKVCHIKNVCSIINNSPEILTQNEINSVYNALLPLTNVSEDIKREHISEIKALSHR